MKDLEAIAFDIDGTLYSDMSLYIRILPYFFKRLPFFLAYNRARKVLHRTAPLADFYEYQARLLAEELKISSAEAKKLIQDNVYDGMKSFFKKIKPYKGVYEFFEECKKRNLKIGILSDFPPEQKGDIWGLSKYCDVIMGSEQCGALKPSIYTFGSFAKELGVSPEKILYVGNSIRADVIGAKRAGMKTAYIMPFWRKIFNIKLEQSDISFKNYRQLMKIVLK